MEFDLPAWLDLSNTTQKFRNDLLLIGSTVFILGFDLVATWLILHDRVEAETGPSPDPGSDNASGVAPSTFTSTVDTASSKWKLIKANVCSLLFASLLIAGVILFPYCFEKGYHGLLIPSAFVVGALFYSREIVSRKLRLLPPAPPSPSDRISLLLATTVAFFLILLRWEKVPIGMNGDVGTICMSGMRMWNDHLHPLRINSSTLPGLLDPLYGGGVLLTDSPFFGNRLYPLFCGILCPVVMYRWVRLIGSRELAWFTTIVMIATPFFQYYSRVPMGTSLWLMELIFFYGMTRSLVTPGKLGPLLAGIALALAQWDYYASRTLVAVGLTAPFLAWPFRRTLAQGWWKRLLVIPLFGIASLLAFPLMDNFGSRQWTFYFSPAYFSVENSDIARNPSILGAKILGHLGMWFSPDWNEARFMTVPSSPVMFGPFAGLLLVGLGFSLYSIFTSIGFLLVSIFIFGIASSLASMGAPNGHRAMTSMLPILLLVGMGFSALWPKPSRQEAYEEGSRKTDEAPFGFIDRLRQSLVLILLLWGCVASIQHFQVDMWKDWRTIRAQEYDENLRALRFREDREKFDVVIAPGPKDIDFFITENDQFTKLDYGNWLPPNWSQRPQAVHATTHVQGLSGLAKSLTPWLRGRECLDPSGNRAGWEYKTGTAKIGSATAARSWSDNGRISGTLMFPHSGNVLLTCKDCRILMEAPISSATAEGTARLQVLRGLNRLSLLPSYRNQPPPQYIHLAYKPLSGETQEHILAPGDLYTIPLHGWLQKVIEMKANEPLQNAKTSISVTPVLFTHNINEEPIYSTASRFLTRYRSIPQLPPGNHSFVLNLGEPRDFEIRIVGVKEIFDATQEQRTLSFSLEAQEVNGKILEILRQDKGRPTSISLDVLSPEGTWEVPPYTWFQPTLYVPPR